MPFDIAVYFDALDRERAMRGLTWAALTRELNAPFAHRRDIHPIAASTLTGMKSRGGLNANIVVHTLMWMGRTPEEFTTHHPVEGRALPLLVDGHLPRWNTRLLVADVGALSAARSLTRAAAAAEIGGYTAGTLKNVERGVGFPHVMGLLAWLGRPAADYVVNVAV